MARKGNQQKNGLDRHSPNHKKGVSDSGSTLPKEKGRGIVSEVKIVAGEEVPNDKQPNMHLRETVNRTNPKKHRLKSDKSPKTENQEIDAAEGPEDLPVSGSNLRDDIGHTCTREASDSREENGSLPIRDNDREYSKTNGLPNGLQADDEKETLVFSEAIIRRAKASAVVLAKAASEWAELQKPWVIDLYTRILKARDYARVKIKHAYPIVLRWLMHVGNIVLLLSMVWLDCALRGIDSFLRMGTMSFFSVIWFSILSIIAMVGICKFLVVLVLAVLTGLFVGFAIGILLIAISGIVFLWLYGSFWTTALVVAIGGLVFMLSRERLALFITTVYSVYCAWTYVGWLGLLLGMNLSFISSDALIFFLKNSVNEHRHPNNPTGTPGMRGRPGFFSETDPSHSADRSSGVPSTSGSDSEITSEDEVVRLLNCSDHYEALGLSRYEDVDVSVLKREYRKKAMLVHPDKNMGNEKAAEAFKKLQNAYEVLLDSMKRKTYDDELRREELLNYFRRFQSASQKDGGHGLFASGFTRTDVDGEDPLLESRRIACRKCGNFHVWVYTKKSKSQARWCQECKDFHQAKDGDGWVEQSSQPFLFGILQKVDPPSAYVCADSKIYDATEWYICQGMRCPVNTHKPSFHVNTNVTSKHNSGKGMGTGQKGCGVPGSGGDENMTEEEFFEWLQNAVQTGMLDNFAGGGTPSESPSSKASSNGGGSNTASGSGSSSKRKKKGKKQR